MKSGTWLPCAVLLLLTACHGDSSPEPQSQPTVHAKKAPPPKRGPSPEELTQGMVEAVPIGKSTLPLTVKFDLPTRPTLGQPLDVVVALLPQAAGSASIQVTGSEGLKVAAEAGSVDIAAVEPSQAYKVNLTTTPSAEGVQLLTLNVTLTHDDVTDSRSFSIPVIVGAAADTAAVIKR